MHENQGAEYEYSAPIAVTLVSPGSNQMVQIPTPFAGGAEYIVEYMNCSTADSSVYVSADTTMPVIPSGGVVMGYLLNGPAYIAPKEVFSNVSQYVTIVANVGATNSYVNVALRFRRAMVVEIPIDVDHPNPHFSQEA